MSPPLGKSFFLNSQTRFKGFQTRLQDKQLVNCQLVKSNAYGRGMYLPYSLGAIKSITTCLIVVFSASGYGGHSD